MATGLYIHVPFCVRKCSYCDFYSVKAEAGAVEAYLEALQAEASLRSHPLPVDTVFFGGGTPSLLNVRQISAVLARVSRYFNLRPDAEITLEINPETIDYQGLKALWGAGINRISMGVQTMQGGLLRILERRHEAADVLRVIAQAQKAGFENISCDLIYGIPGQTLADWSQDLHMLSGLGLTHISLYALEVHGETPLQAAINLGLVPDINEDLMADMYDLARNYLRDRGYLQYEISNFSMPGYRCRHNLNYWHNGNYIGLGPAACSYWQGVRDCNESDLEIYTRQLAMGKRPLAFAESLGKEETMAETIILGLRLTDGICAEDFKQRFGLWPQEAFGDTITRLLKKAWLLPTSRGYVLPEAMYLLANAVFREFLTDSNT